MARGWESKSVGDQIESLAAERNSLNPGRRLTPQEIEHQRQREALLLSRTRVLHELEATRIPRRREILQASLAYLDAKLAALG